MIAPIENIKIWSPTADYTQDAELCVFPITDNCERNVTLMGEDYIKLVFAFEERITLEAFSYTEYDGQLYFLRERYRPTPKGSHYQYEFKMSSIGNMLDKHICFRYYSNLELVNDEGATYSDIQPEPNFAMNGNLADLAEIIVRSIQGAAERVPIANSYYAGLLNSCELSQDDLLADTPLTTFNFESTNIADALTQIADEFETEWWLSIDYGTLKLHLCKCEDTENNPIQVSDIVTRTNNSLIPYRSQGLQSCGYAQEWSNIPQRILAYGSERNIVRTQAMDNLRDKQVYVSYGKRLRLTPNHTYIVKDEEGNNVELETDAFGAVENEGVTSGIEITELFEDIYPQGHFVVTRVEKLPKCYQITAQACQLDGEGKPLKENGQYVLISESAVVRNPYMILPISKKDQQEDPLIHFESGYLNGREFGIVDKSKVTYNNRSVDTCTLVLQIAPDTNSEDESLTLPSGNFIPRAKSEEYEGDLFALFNIDMPNGYVGMAEQALAQATYNKLMEYQASRPDVKCNAEPSFFDNVPSVYIGQRYDVFSELFGDVVVTNDVQSGEVIDIHNSLVFTSRVTAFSYSLTKPCEVEFTLASAMVKGTIAELEAAISDKTSEIRGLEQRSINLSLRGYRDAAEMQDMLQSLVAEMMLVGVSKYQFAFTFAIDVVNATTSSVTDGLKHSTTLLIGSPSGGYLQHTQSPYIDYDNKGRWELPAAVSINLWRDSNSMQEYDPELPYYLYAVCPDDESVLSQTSFVLVPKSDSNMQEDTDGTLHPTTYFYEDYLLLGILSSEYYDSVAGTSYRVFNRSNGYTQIAGGTITTEQIQDPTRSLIIDFQSNPPQIIAKNGAKIVGNIEFTMNGTATNLVTKLSEIGAISNQAAAQAAEAVTIAEGAKEIHNYYEGGDIVVNYISTDYPRIVSLLSLSAGIYKFDNTSEDNGNQTGGAVDPFNTSCVVIFKANHTFNGIDLWSSADSAAVIDVLNWGAEIELDEPSQAYVFLCEKGYMDYIVSNGAWDGTEMLHSGTWRISGIQVLSSFQKLIEEAIDKADRAYDKATALDYLKAALTNGTTTIAGGITLTHVMMLKNIAGRVTAGMDGETAGGNNLLLWSGGNYQEAYDAVNNDGTPLPVLLTKNGIGSRIGCLQVISETEVDVISTLGTIKIDTESGGIRIVEDNAEKIIIEPNPIGQYIPEAIDYSGSYSNKSFYSLPQDGYNKILDFTLSSQNTVIIEQLTAVCQGVYANHAGSTTHYATTGTLTFILRDGNSNQVWSSSSTFSLTATESGMGNIISAVMSGISMTLPAGTYSLYIVVTSNNNYYSISTVNNNRLYGEYRYSVSDSTTSQTIIGIDGILSIFNAKTYFMVKNSSSGQQIITKGLKSEQSNTSGELYVSDKLLTAFDALIDTLKTIVEHVRSVGNNEQNADAWKAQLDDVNELIKESGIIAVS